MQRSLRRKIKTERMENIYFTSQQVRAARCSQKPCTTFGIFLPFSSDLSWMLKLLFLLWFSPSQRKAWRTFLSLYVLFPVLQGKVAPASAGTLNKASVGEKVSECFAGVQHSCTLRSSPGMETDEKRERCGKKKDVVIIEVHPSEDKQKGPICSILLCAPCISYRQRCLHKGPGKCGSFMLSWLSHKWLLKVEIIKKPCVSLGSRADKFSPMSLWSIATLNIWFVFHWDWQRTC